MNTSGWEFEKLAAFQAQAKAALRALPAAEQEVYMNRAAQRYSFCWNSVVPEAKADCALLEYIESLPEINHP